MVFVTDRQDNFEFKGFIPRTALKQKGKQVYSLVENRSPSESAKVASVTKTKEGYQARLKVASNACDFELIVNKKNCSAAIDQIYSQFLDEILDWNKTRSS